MKSFLALVYEYVSLAVIYKLVCSKQWQNLH